MEIAYQKLSDGVWVASPKESIDSTSAEEFGQKLHQLLEQQTRHLLIDMGQVKYISSVGLGKLIELMKKSSAAGSSFALYDTQLPVKRVLEISKLDFIELKPSNLATDHPFNGYIQSEEPKRALEKQKKLKEKEEADKRYAKQKSGKK